MSKTKGARALLLIVARRLREPSTMAGLSALAMLAGVPAGVPESVAQAIAGIAGALAVFLPERAPE